MRELERADVAGAHDMGSRAEVGELAVAVERDRFVLGDVLNDIELELGCHTARSEGGQFTALGHSEGIGAGNFNALEDMVGLDLAFHILLDAGEILRRDAVGELEVVVKSVFHWRTCRELGLGPDFQNCRGKHMGGGVADAFEFSHGMAGFKDFLPRRTWRSRSGRREFWNGNGGGWNEKWDAVFNRVGHRGVHPYPSRLQRGVRRYFP